MAANSKAIFVTSASANSADFIFFATSDAKGNIAVSLVGVTNLLDINQFTAANFMV